LNAWSFASTPIYIVRYWCFVSVYLPTLCLVTGLYNICGKKISGPYEHTAILGVYFDFYTV
jgi:hypothetical protein